MKLEEGQAGSESDVAPPLVVSSRHERVWPPTSFPLECDSLGLPPSARVLSLTTATEGQQLRTVVTRSRERSTGKYPSWTMNQMLEWESPFELNAMYSLDADPAVSS